MLKQREMNFSPRSVLRYEQRSPAPARAMAVSLISDESIGAEGFQAASFVHT